MSQGKRDGFQVLKGAWNESNQALQVQGISGALVTVPFDSLALTYVPSGYGAGQIQTVIYYVGGLSGNQVAELTLSYDVNNNLVGVVKS